MEQSKAQAAVKAFFPPLPPVDPAGMTFTTLNLTVLERGLFTVQKQYFSNEQYYLGRLYSGLEN